MSLPIQLDIIAWHDRAMTVRGTVYYLGREPVIATIAYAHVSNCRLLNEQDGWVLCFEAGPMTYVLTCQCEGVARDAAAELARRMEAVR